MLSAGMLRKKNLESDMSSQFLPHVLSALHELSHGILITSHKRWYSQHPTLKERKLKHRGDKNLPKNGN